MHSSGSILHILPVLQLMVDKERKAKLEKKYFLFDFSAFQTLSLIVVQI